MAAVSTGEMADGPTEQKTPLHILTVKINGLRTNGNKLLEELEKLKSEEKEVDVVFLTDTHIGENKTDRDLLENYEENWKTFLTRCDSRSKGAAILVNKKRSFRCLDQTLDGLGRYVILNCWISETLCTFVSVYHHSKERGLLKELSQKIKPLDPEILVIGGNFNTVLDEEKDRTSRAYNYTHNRIRKELLSFMKEHDLKDAWREKNPDERHYTYDYRGGLQSRLDYFFINADKRELVKHCIINKDKIADHRSVSLFLDLKDQIRKLKIFPSTVPDLPSDKDLKKLRPDIILLAKGKAEHKEYIKKLEEEDRETRWTVCWSEHSNAAILVAETQRDIQIVFTDYHEDYVILLCKVLDIPYTFVSACNPTERSLQNMLREIVHSESGGVVLGVDFGTSEQRIMEFLNANDFHNPKGGSTQMPSVIHDTLKQHSEIKTQEIAEDTYPSLILKLSQDEDPKNADITSFM